jgi:hypothetical protein
VGHAAGRVGSISKTGWLFADLLLVLAIVFLGTQGSVPTQRIWSLSHPVHVNIHVDSSGLISGNKQSQVALARALLATSAGKDLRKGTPVGLVITFAGGPGCDVRGAEATSQAINRVLFQIFPKSVHGEVTNLGPTETQAYIDLGCASANQADLQFFFFRSKLVG